MSENITEREWEALEGFRQENIRIRGERDRLRQYIRNNEASWEYSMTNAEIEKESSTLQPGDMTIAAATPIIRRQVIAELLNDSEREFLEYFQRHHVQLWLRSYQ